MSAEAINAKQLAERFGVAQSTITAYRVAGYQFRFGRKTTYSHFLAWIEANKETAMGAVTMYRRICARRAKAATRAAGRRSLSAGDKSDLPLPCGQSTGTPAPSCNPRGAAA